MLPSKGYFAEIPCVFYLGEGCRRPCCHYRHSLQDVKRNQEDVKRKKTETNSSWSEDQIHLVTKLVEKAVDKAFLEEPVGNLKMGRTEMLEVTLNRLLQDKQAVKWALSNKTCHNDEVPSYNPTPIAKLNDRHIPVAFVPAKPVVKTSKSRNRFVAPSIPSNSITPFTQSPLKKYTELDDQPSANNVFMDGIYCYSSNPVIDVESQNRSSLMDCQSVAFEDTPSGAASSIIGSLESSTIPPKVHRPANDTQKHQNSKSSSIGSEDLLAEQPSHAYKKSSVRIKSRTKHHKNIKERMNADRFSTLTPLLENHTASCSKISPKHSKNKSPNKENHDSLLTTCTNGGQNNLKTSLSLKHHKTKSDVIIESSQVEGTVEEPKLLKRSYSDYTSGLVPVKKSMKESIDIVNEVAKQPPTTVNLQVSSNIDPFTRWMNNKRIREILGKNKFKTQTTNNNPKSEKIDVPKNPAFANDHENGDSEPLPVPKFTPRVAHRKDEVRPYPSVLDGSKIPLSHRQHFCDAFFREFKKSMSVEEAKSEAVKKELEVAKGSGVKSYKNHGSLQLMKLRKNGCARDTEEKENVKLEPSSCPDFTYGWSLYRCFSKYLLSEDELKENGYPLPITGKPNCAFVEKSARKYSKEQPNKKSIRICANCSEEFRIDDNGVPVSKDNCFFHWGKLKKVRSMGQWMEKFSCCDGFGDSAPCESSVYHVWSGRNEDCMEDFIETTKLPSYMEDSYAGVYALDCEMCYTTRGLELARLTVIDLNEAVVFDQVVSLKNPVLEYCTRFSGIDEKKIREATYSFDDVRAWVLEHFFDKTILIGHSLENDLKVLKLIHKTVIDTSVTFPHKFGPPQKMSLKHLASSLLKINIQEEEGGHDSKEDAATCLKLMMMKVREDSKVRKPRIIIGYVGKKR